MTTRTMFTEAIEDHLALKKQNNALEAQLPLAQFDLGDPLDRFPGGRGHAPASSLAGAAPMVANAGETQLMDGPTPDQAMRAAMSIEPGVEHPFEPLSGMTPMLSLVEDLDDHDEAINAAMQGRSGNTGELPASAASVLRFPGGVGPRDGAAATSGSMPAATATPTSSASASATHNEFDIDDAPTGEHPVIVVDTDEPFGSDSGTAREPRAPRQSGGKRPKFFGLGKKRKGKADGKDGWFGEGSRDFNWD